VHYVFLAYLISHSVQEALHLFHRVRSRASLNYIDVAIIALLFIAGLMRLGA